MISVGLSMKKTLTNSFQMYKNHTFATKFYHTFAICTFKYTNVHNRFYIVFIHSNLVQSSKFNFDGIRYPKGPKHIMMDLIDSY